MCSHADVELGRGASLLFVELIAEKLFHALNYSRREIHAAPLSFGIPRPMIGACSSSHQVDKSRILYL